VPEFVVNTTCWNFGGKGYRLQTVLTRKQEEMNIWEEMQLLNRLKSLKESGLLPGMVSLTRKSYLESFTSTTPQSSARKKVAGGF